MRAERYPSDVWQSAFNYPRARCPKRCSNSPRTDLVHQDDTGRFFVPMATERDVLETYTARGLLGTAIVWRLASRAHPLPDGVDVVFNELIGAAFQGHMEETGSLDLDVQDESARAAECPVSRPCFYDNCARYMVLQLAERPRERATRSMQRS
jgi:hypothetical protein